MVGDYLKGILIDGKHFQHLNDSTLWEMLVKNSIQHRAPGWLTIYLQAHMAYYCTECQQLKHNGKYLCITN